MNAVIDMCNITYDVAEGRPFWKAQGVSVMLSIAASSMLVAALVLILCGPTIADAVFPHHPLAAGLWKILQWPVAMFFVLASFALVYYFGPDVAHRQWHWITPGSVFGMALWLVASFSFRAYLHFFNSYSVAYGSLAAPIILLVWMYLTGAAVMIGSELNAEIEYAASELGKPENQASGNGARAA
jgi:membrane protein